MQSDITGQVLGVTGSPTRNGGTKYDVAFSDGTSYSTFDGALAQKANSLAGQAVSARVEAKPSRDGQRTFFNLVDVAPQGQLVPAAGTPIGAGSFPVQQVNQNAAALGIPMQPQVNQAEKDARIAKQVALKVAGGIVGSLFQGAGPEATDELLETLDKVGANIYARIQGAQAPSVTPTDQTPEAVAEAVNEAAGTPVVGVGAGEIPW